MLPARGIWESVAWLDLSAWHLALKSMHFNMEIDTGDRSLNTTTWVYDKDRTGTMAEPQLEATHALELVRKDLNCNSVHFIAQ